MVRNTSTRAFKRAIWFLTSWEAVWSFQRWIAGKARCSKPAEFLEQTGADFLRVQVLFELRGGELLNLLLGVFDSALIADPASDLLHDLLDVDGIGAEVGVSHG